MKLPPFQFGHAVFLAAALTFANATLLAQDDTMSAPARASKAGLNFLEAGHPTAAGILPPPPALDSVEQAADMASVQSIYHAASDSDKSAAYSEKEFSVYNFTGAVGPWFVETNLPQTTAFFKKVQHDAETVTDAGKDFFKRPRPFVTDPALKNGKLEKSFSYPSGHSTESMVLALVLADLLPDQHDAIIAHARTMGWHRLQIARHYPTDIYAGRCLAQAIANDFKKNDAYEKEFAGVQAELKAAREAAHN